MPAGLLAISTLAGLAIIGPLFYPTDRSKVGSEVSIYAFASPDHDKTHPIELAVLFQPDVEPQIEITVSEPISSTAISRTVDIVAFGIKSCKVSSGSTSATYSARPELSGIGFTYKPKRFEFEFTGYSAALSCALDQSGQPFQVDYQTQRVGFSIGGPAVIIRNIANRLGIPGSFEQLESATFSIPNAYTEPAWDGGLSARPDARPIRNYQRYLDFSQIGRSNFAMATYIVPSRKKQYDVGLFAGGIAFGIWAQSFVELIRSLYKRAIGIGSDF